MYLNYKRIHGDQPWAEAQRRRQFEDWAVSKGYSHHGNELLGCDTSYSYDPNGDADYFIDAVSSGVHLLRNPHFNQVKTPCRQGCTCSETPTLTR